jgi:hypothetical protein
MDSYIDGLYQRFNSLSSAVGGIYDREKIRHLLHQQCYSLLPVLEELLPEFEASLTEERMMALLTLVMMVHRLIALRIIPIDASLAKWAVSECESESALVKRIAAINELARQYEMWLHRLLIEMQGEVVMMSFELLPYLNPDLLGELHRAFMVERFVRQVDHSTSIEAAIFKRLEGTGVASETLWRAGEMLVDLDTSRRIGEAFNQSTPIDTSVVLHPLIVRSSVWGMPSATRMPRLPTDVADEFKRIETYMQEFESTSTRPLPDRSWAVIDLLGAEERVYHVQLTLSQLAVLACFNDHLQISAVRLGEITELGRERAGTIAMALFQAKILRRKPAKSGNRTLHHDDIFALNTNFQGADRDFSITSLDDGQNCALAQSWSPTTLRKAMRAELRGAVGMTMTRSELHVAMFRLFDGLSHSAFSTEIRKMRRAGLIRILEPGKMVAPQVVPQSLRDLLGEAAAGDAWIEPDVMLEQIKIYMEESEMTVQDDSETLYQIRGCVRDAFTDVLDSVKDVKHMKRGVLEDALSDLIKSLYKHASDAAASEETADDNGAAPGGPQSLATASSKFLPDELRMLLFPDTPSRTIKLYSTVVSQARKWMVDNDVLNRSMSSFLQAMPEIFRRWLPEIGARPCLGEFKTAVRKLCSGEIRVRSRIPDTRRIMLVNIRHNERLRNAELHKRKNLNNPDHDRQSNMVQSSGAVSRKSSKSRSRSRSHKKKKMSSRKKRSTAK